MFSVIYYQLFQTRLFRIPIYFELIVLSLHLKSTPLFRTWQKQSTYIRAQLALETYCTLFELDSRALSRSKKFQLCYSFMIDKSIRKNQKQQNIQRFFNPTYNYTVFLIVTNFTLPRLFRNPAISNFFSISLGTSK